MKEKPIKILLIEDDVAIRMGIKDQIQQYGSIDEADTLSSALELLATNDYDISFIDLDLDVKRAGFELIPESLKKNIYTVMLSGHDDKEVITQAIRLGCNYYLIKKGNLEKLHEVFARFKKSRANNNEELLNHFIANSFYTNDNKLISDLKFIFNNDYGDRPIFIDGPSGVGKSFIAKEIHERSSRQGKPFIEINCGQFNEGSLESELFGHVKGAFTDAKADKKGFLAQADGGTLFLDEIGNMPLTLQIKLLTAIEKKEFYLVGSSKVVKSNFRVISATCADLGEMIEKKHFRLDFFMRINDIKINIAPLHNRPGDISYQIAKFMQSQRQIVFSDEAESFLVNQYPWPGNSRELHKLITTLCYSDLNIVELGDVKSILNVETHKIQTILTEDQLRYITEVGLTNYLNRIKEECRIKFLQQNNYNVRAARRELKVGSSFFYDHKKKEIVNNA